MSLEKCLRQLRELIQKVLPRKGKNTKDLLLGQWENQVCRSLNEAENWFRSDEWTGNIEKDPF